MGSCLKILRGVPLNASYQHTIAPHTDPEDKKVPMNMRDAVLKYFKSLAVFSTKTTGESQFVNKAPISYIRESDNAVKVNVRRDDLEGCNYLMFTNDLATDTYTPSSDDSCFWHFAFIDSLEYISEGATRITFTIDVLQTWLPFIYAQSALVTREHAMTDEIGDNLIAEPLSIGQYVSAGDDFLESENYVNPNTSDLGEWSAKHRFFSKAPSHEIADWYALEGLDTCWVALVSYTQGRQFGLLEKKITGRTPFTDSNEYKWTVGTAGVLTSKTCVSFFNGAYGANTIALRLRIKSLKEEQADKENDIYWLYTLLNAIVAQLSGEVLNVSFVPLKFFAKKYATPIMNLGFTYLENEVSPFGTLRITRDFSSLNVKNNKVFTYPFTRIVASSQSASVIYRPEFFEDTVQGHKDIVFEGTLSLNPAAALTVQPKKYIVKGNDKQIKKVDDWYKLNYSGTDSLTITDFPTMIFSIDNMSYYVRDSLIEDTSKALTNALQTGFDRSMTSAMPAKTPLQIFSKRANILQLGINATVSALSLVGTFLNASQAPPKQGGASSNVSSLVTGEIGIDVRVEVPSPSELKAIDSYFTTYGYALNAVKTPNIFKRYYYTKAEGTNWIKSTTVRPAFNYIECEQITFRQKPTDKGGIATNNYTMFTLKDTVANRFKGYMPSTDELEILVAIFQRGVTFWESPELIGEYGDNNPNGIVKPTTTKETA